MNAVTVASVHKSYGDRAVIDGIDCAVEPGEFVSLIGPSGCGKSTLFSIVAGLEQPDTGEVLVGDSPAHPRRSR